MKRGSGRPSAYRRADGSKVPSVTTVLSRFKESDRLLSWAWKLGREGRDFRRVRDGAASIGSRIHEAAEHWLHGKPAEECEEEILRKLVVPEQAARALLGFESVRRWVEKRGIVVKETEVPLVSEVHGFAGCPDWLVQGEHEGITDLLDVKSGKGVYADHLLQLAAYDILYEENRGEWFGHFTILHVPQDGSECKAYEWAPKDLLPARDMFLALLDAYRLDAKVNATLKVVMDADSERLAA